MVPQVLASELAASVGPSVSGRVGPCPRSVGSEIRIAIRVCENFLYRFKAAPRGRSRRRLGRRSRAPAGAPARLAQAGRLARKACNVRGRGTTRSHQGRGGFDKGTLAAALIGLMRAGRSQPDPPTSVRAAAPCQIRRSVRAELSDRRWLAPW